MPRRTNSPSNLPTAPTGVGISDGLGHVKIQVESGIEMPPGRMAVNGKLAALRNALAAMKPGDSFMWECNKAPFDAARQLNVKISTRKINGEGYRVWRVA